MPKTPPSSEGLIEQVVRLQRIIHRIKAQPTGDGPRDRSSHVLLFTIFRQGPLRIADLATAAYVDASVVSRQAAELVAEGLLVRAPHPDDGRSAVMALTDQGEQFVQTMLVRRRSFFDRAVSDWSETELATFTRLLERFVDDTEQTYAATATPQGPSA
ncbi:MAG: MarR family transcriptional regulator [Actinomycetota bacterium]|nr:MarR family transcriptional regulator [Actinomycetota bacterium]